MNKEKEVSAKDAADVNAENIWTSGQDEGDPVESGTTDAENTEATECEAEGGIEAQLHEAQEVGKENLEKFLRKSADLDNFKKRAQKEKAELAMYSNESLIKELLPVIDSLGKALEHFAEDKNTEAAVKSLRDGVEHTLKNFVGALSKFGLTEIDALGQKFDPAVHEAMSHEESDGAERDTVTQELQKGYSLNSRLLRPALVIIAK